MFCTQCGTRLDDAARFCISCGKPIGAPPRPGQDAPPRPGQDAPPPAGPNAAPPNNPPYNGWANTAEPPRKLRRIRADKKIAGVCAGFAEYFDMDPTIMRLIWVALLLLPPSIGLIAYVVAWIVLPVS